MASDVDAQFLASLGTFNLNFLFPGPLGTGSQALGTNGGSGDNISLTEFQPAVVSTPEPDTAGLTLLGTGLLGLLGLAARRKRHAPSATC